MDIDRLLEAVTYLLANFGPSHPCPYCLEHFMSRVSRNDADWVRLHKGGRPKADF